jgi:cytoskeletal protein RodZ
MPKRIQKLVMSVAALAALALGGAAFAQAQSSSTPPPEKASAVDGDTVQSGDQTTPDTPTAKTTRFHAVKAAATTPADPAGGSNAQGPDTGTTPADPAGGSNAQGPDTGTTPETPGAESPETGAGSETGPSDGPGGHADPAGATGADHQFQGNE